MRIQSFVKDVLKTMMLRSLIPIMVDMERLAMLMMIWML